jgi:hypothetical protein
MKTGLSFGKLASIAAATSFGRLGPDLDELLAALLVGDQATLVLASTLAARLVALEDLFLSAA